MSFIIPMMKTRTLTLKTLTKTNKSLKRPTNSNSSWLKNMISSKNKGLKTPRKKLYDINIWKQYLSSAGEERNIVDIPAKELNLHISRFFMEIKKKNGGKYEPASLTSFHRSLQRYLHDHSSHLNILKDQEFSSSPEALSSRKRQLVCDFGELSTSRSSLDGYRGRLDV